MLLIMAAELAATGALVIRSFQGLSEGKSCWPSSAGTRRVSSSSIRGRCNTLLASLLLWRGGGRMPRSHPLGNMKQPLGDKGYASHVHRTGVVEMILVVAGGVPCWGKEPSPEEMY